MDIDSIVDSLDLSAGAPEPGQVETAPAPEPEPQETEQESEATEDGEEGEEKPAEEPPAKPWKKKGPPETVPYGEFSKSRAELREERERVAELQRRLDEIQSSAKPEPAPENDLGLPPEPKPEDFKSWEEYQSAARAWDRNAAKAEAMAEFTRQSQAQAQAQQAQAQVVSFVQRVEEAQKSDPELAEVREYIAPVIDHLPQVIQQALVSDENPGALLKALADMAPDQRSLVAMAQSNPGRMLMHLGRASATAAAVPNAPAPKIAAAAPPVKTVPPAQGRTGARKLSTMPMNASEILKYAMG